MDVSFSVDFCFGVPFADGGLRWVFRSRGEQLFWCTQCRRISQIGVSFSQRTAVLVYALQTDFSDGCLVILAEDFRFGVPFADGWVFRSR